MEVKDYLGNIFDKLDERTKNILLSSGDDSNYIFTEIRKFYNIELKAKGKLKKDKIRKRCVTYARKESREIFKTLKPSMRTTLFHVLLKALDDTCSLMNHKSKLYYTIAEENDLTIEETLKTVDRDIIKFNGNIVIKKCEETLKTEFSKIDSRVSNFLYKKKFDNDSAINREILNNNIILISKSVNIDDKEEQFKYFLDETSVVEEVYKSITLVRVLVEQIENLSKEDIKNYKYCATRLYNFIEKLETKIKDINKFLKNNEHSKLIERAFKQCDELPSIDDLVSYSDYLEYLESKRKIRGEYKIVGVKWRE